MVALARNVGELGEVDPQVGELPELCWGPRRGSEGAAGTHALDAEVHRNSRGGLRASGRGTGTKSSSRVISKDQTLLLDTSEVPEQQSNTQLEALFAEDLLPAGLPRLSALHHR